MPRFPIVVVLLVVGCSAKTPAPIDKQPVTLKPGLGVVHHPVSTTNPEAQAFFDQGMAQYYGFNHHEALRSFRQAARVDPNCAMAYWGEALALGPNINLPQIDAATEALAATAVVNARKHLERAWPIERAYIDALAIRYCAMPGSDAAARARDYARSMEHLTRQFPADLDARTLYAEAMMDLRPWKLYRADGTPEEGTESIVATLEAVLKRDPDHVGANHLYIHATEASKTPQRAMESAKRLPMLAPASGHLVHMPSHVYMRVGDYAGAVVANQQAAAVDEQYIASCHPTGLYPATYYNHNVHFLYIAACFTGQSQLSLDAADKVSRSTENVAASMPMVEPYAASRLIAQVRFGKWDAIRETPEPAASMSMTRCVWHAARGFAAIEAGQIEEAQSHLEQLRTLRGQLADTCLAGLNPACVVLEAPEHVLAGRLLESAGDRSSALSEFRAAVAAQDALAYDEPPFWPIPAREAFGAATLRTGDAEGAERIFRADLEINPKNPRSLFGLAEALRAQKKDASKVEAELKQAWKDADGELKLENF